MVEGKPRSPVLTFGLIEILKESVCKGNGSRVQVLAAFGTTSKGLRSLLEKRIRLQLTENMGIIHRYERGRLSETVRDFAKVLRRHEAGTFSHFHFGIMCCAQADRRGFAAKTAATEAARADVATTDEGARPVLPRRHSAGQDLFPGKKQSVR